MADDDCHAPDGIDRDAGVPDEPHDDLLPRCLRRPVVHPPAVVHGAPVSASV